MTNFVMTGHGSLRTPIRTVLLGPFNHPTRTIFYHSRVRIQISNKLFEKVVISGNKRKTNHPLLDSLARNAVMAMQWILQNLQVSATFPGCLLHAATKVVRQCAQSRQVTWHLLVHGFHIVVNLKAISVKVANMLRLSCWKYKFKFSINCNYSEKMHMIHNANTSPSSLFERWL